jgi:hypothetical protein
MYLTTIAVKDKHIKHKETNAYDRNDFMSEVYLNILHRLDNAKDRIDFTRDDLQLLVYIKNLINYSILAESQKIIRKNHKYKDIQIVDLTEDLENKMYFEPVFDLALDYRINGEVPLWIGIDG